MNLSRVDVDTITVPDVPGVTVKVYLSSKMDDRWKNCVASALNDDLQVGYRDIDDNFIVIGTEDDVDGVVAQIDTAIGLANARYSHDADAD